MDFSKQLRQGRKAAMQFRKDPTMITFKLDKKVRDAAMVKCDKMGISMAAYLRICVVKLTELPIEYHVEQMYKEIIKEATKATFEEAGMIKANKSYYLKRKEKAEAKAREKAATEKASS